MNLNPGKLIDQVLVNDVIDVNLTGVFLCCQEVGKIMKKQAPE